MNDKEIEARFNKQDIINGRVSSRLFMIDEQLATIMESLKTITDVTTSHVTSLDRNSKDIEKLLQMIEKIIGVAIHQNEPGDGHDEFG